MIQIDVVHADITTVASDAIVNAANSSLLGGGGVDGAIHRAAGPALLAECRAVRARQGGCQAGEAVITGAGDLPADYVIHTVGPVWDENNATYLDGVLADCYRNPIELAVQNDVVSLAFPGISTGVYRYPKERATRIAIAAVRETCAALDEATLLQHVVFVCFEDGDQAIYERLLAEPV